MLRKLCIFLALIALAAPLAARERSEIPEDLKWNLNEIYPSREAWLAARDGLVTRIPQLEKHRGHL
ncbi:MAG: oligoendopeptidase F, partial [Candidatus Eremiobacteraeota bacterium]|nr:oligoendopeptidase F [Candidatus Eremiobacteraeota bacterium]